MLNRPVVSADLVAPIFDPKTFGNRDVVHGIFTKLRAEHPLSLAEVPGYDPHWIVTKYDDIREITRQDDLFHSGDHSKTVASKAAGDLVREFTGGSIHIFRTLVQMDGPDHADYRAVTAPRFMPQAVRKLEPLIREKAKKYIDLMAAHGGEMDFAKELALLYPLDVICTLIDIQDEDQADTLCLSQWLFSYADPDLMRPGADISDPAEVTRTWSIVYREWNDYFSKIASDRRACPREDLASVIANANIRGCPMAHKEMISYFVIAASAGHDTSAATTGIAMWVLAEQPELLQRLKADPALIPKFVEEAIRWASPVQHFVRSAAADYELRGRNIKRGAVRSGSAADVLHRRGRRHRACQRFRVRIGGECLVRR